MTSDEDQPVVEVVKLWTPEDVERMVAAHAADIWARILEEEEPDQ